MAAGTVGGSIECNVETGLCNCKLNVMNSQCNECKDEFYGLATENTAGNFANLIENKTLSKHTLETYYRLQLLKRQTFHLHFQAVIHVTVITEVQLVLFVIKEQLDNARVGEI